MFDLNLWAKCQERSMMGDVRMEQIHSLMTESLSLTPPHHAIAEIGVLKGGTSKYLSMVASDRKIYLFDTFNGLPEDFINPMDGIWNKNDFSDIHIDEVKRYLSDCDNIVLNPGIFPFTAHQLLEKYFCFVLIDCVLYYSTYSSLLYFSNKVNQYSNIIVDDYGRPECPGVKIAVDNFLNQNKNFKSKELNDFMIQINKGGY